MNIFSYHKHHMDSNQKICLRIPNFFSIFALISKEIFELNIMEYPKLNYPPIHLRARHGEAGRPEVFDKVRGKWLVLTPEEWVRRHVVEYMLANSNLQPQQIIEEYPVEVNGMAQRADIVAIDCNGKPYIVVECKEPNIKIDAEVLAQVVRYNSILKGRYVVITNGIATYCYAHDEAGKYTPINHFPALP